MEIDLSDLYFPDLFEYDMLGVLKATNVILAILVLLILCFLLYNVYKYLFK